MENIRLNITKGFQKGPACRQAGFTLVEIVIVMALIGVTATLFISLVNPAQQFRKSNDAKRKADLRQLQAAFELYHADTGLYPPEPLPDCGSPLVNGTTTYLQKIPCDPKDGTPQFVYNYSSPLQTTYTLVACLENVSDLQKDETNDSTHCTGDTTNWSYTLTNP